MIVYRSTSNERYGDRTMFLKETRSTYFTLWVESLDRSTTVPACFLYDSVVVIASTENWYTWEQNRHWSKSLNNESNNTTLLRFFRHRIRCIRNFSLSAFWIIVGGLPICNTITLTPRSLPLLLIPSFSWLTIKCCKIYYRKDVLLFKMLPRVRSFETYVSFLKCVGFDIF